MNEQQNSNVKDWPMVPIFRRRKRPRQALYAEPSVAFDRYNEKENTPKALDGNSKQNDLLNASFEILGMDEDNFLDSVTEDKAFTERKQSFEVTERAVQSSSKLTQMVKTESTRTYIRNINRDEKDRKSYAPGLLKMPKKEGFREKEAPQTKETHQPIPPAHTKVQKSPNARKGPTVPRMLTVSSKDIKEIIGHKDMMPALYEVYGLLDSTVTSLVTSGPKRFTVRDDVGVVRCIFWEIDRPFPPTRRGTLIRCVGRITNDIFQCLSIRPTTQEEINWSKKVHLTKSQKVIQQYIVNKKEH